MKRPQKIQLYIMYIDDLFGVNAQILQNPCQAREIHLFSFQK